MIIDQINLNHLRIFECVFRTRSMTEASQELHLTQSGVSQHIKAFEETLGLKLFDRVKQKLVPTAAAVTLFESCGRTLHGLEQTFVEITGGARRLSGTVSIGMPIEFGNNVVMPLLARFSKAHPAVRFTLHMGFASEMSERIMDGSLDFAIVDSFEMDQRIALEKVYDEILDLCIDPALLKKAPPPASHRKSRAETREYYESLDYVEYQKGEPVLRMWFGHHLKTRNLDLTVKATVMDVQGLTRLVLAGMGAGVLPHHLVLKLLQEGRKLHVFKGCGKPLKNSIQLASLRGRTHSLAARAMIEWLKESLVSEQTPVRA